MQLLQWIQARPRGSVARLAKATGISRQTIDKVCKGRRPSIDIAVRIEIETGGEVTAEELVGLDEIRARVAKERTKDSKKKLDYLERLASSSKGRAA